MITKLLLIACDDETEIEIDLDDDKFKFVKELSKLFYITYNGKNCKPTLIVNPIYNKYKDAQRDFNNPHKPKSIQEINAYVDCYDMGNEENYPTDKLMEYRENG